MIEKRKVKPPASGKRIPMSEAWPGIEQYGKEIKEWAERSKHCRDLMGRSRPPY